MGYPGEPVRGGLARPQRRRHPRPGHRFDPRRSAGDRPGRHRLRALARRARRCCARRLLPVDDTYADARQAFWAHRLDALSPVVARGIERGDLRADTDARLLLETLVAPIHGRLLLTGEPVDDDLAERLVDQALNGVATTVVNRERAVRLSIARSHFRFSASLC